MPWPTDSLPWILFVTGLAGGAGHCVGMCGPLVAGYAIALRNRVASLPHLLFHLGRVTTYGIAGGVVGASGSFARIAAWVAPFQQLLLATTGLLIALMGMSVGGWFPWARRVEGTGRSEALSPASRVGRPRRGAPGPPFLSGWRRGCSLADWSTPPSCPRRAPGWRRVPRPRDSMRGSLAMAAFGAGTVPALFLFGRVIASVGPRLRGALAKVAAALLVLSGALFAARAFLR